MLKDKGNVAVPPLIIAVIVIVLGIVLGYWLWRQNSTSNLGSQIFKQAQKNPSGNIPETNPFTKVNPFKGVYKNPFE